LIAFNAYFNPAAATAVPIPGNKPNAKVETATTLLVGNEEAPLITLMKG
jgi:hypothetical protein